MSETPEKRFADVKSYEISYAVFRVASEIKNPAFRERLEARALTLIDATVGKNYPRVGDELRVIEYLLRFASDVGAVHFESVEKIVAELAVLNDTIENLEKPKAAQPTNLEGIFSKKETMVRQEVEPRQGGVEKEVMEEGPGSMGGIIRSGIRQSAILDRIRQTGNCRLKDIQEILPEASERTIRYDLQSLVEQKLIERVGNGGPAVYYRVRQNA